VVGIYKVIVAFISLLNQIFDDKNKNGKVKGANNNQVYIRGILNLLNYLSTYFL